MRFAEQWSWCTVDAICDVTPTIREFRLRPESGHVVPYPAGSHIGVTVLIDGQPARRSYSLVENSDAGTYRIAVRLAPDSRGGSRSMWNLRVGARIETSNPTSLLEIDWTRKNYCLIAGGIGITPIAAMAREARQRGLDYRLHYCGRSREAMALADELQALHGQRLQLHLSGQGGRADLGVITAAARSGSAQVWACGPERLLDALQALADDQAAPWPDDVLHIEHFTAHPATLDASKEQAFEVELKVSGLTLPVPADRTLLSVLRAANLDIPSDCEEGLCGSCEVRVISGLLDHRDRVLTRAERAAGDRLLSCCSRACGGQKLVLDL